MELSKSYRDARQQKNENTITQIKRSFQFLDGNKKSMLIQIVDAVSPDDTGVPIFWVVAFAKDVQPDPKSDKMAAYVDFALGSIMEGAAESLKVALMEAVKEWVAKNYDQPKNDFTATGVL